MERYVELVLSYLRLGGGSTEANMPTHTAASIRNQILSLIYPPMILISLFQQIPKSFFGTDEIRQAQSLQLSPETGHIYGQGIFVYKASVLFLYNLPVEAAGYGGLLCAIALLLSTGADFYVYRRKILYLESLQGQAALLLDKLPEPRGPKEEAYHALLLAEMGVLIWWAHIV